MNSYELLHDELVEVSAVLGVSCDKSLQLMFLSELKELNRNLNNIELALDDIR